MAHRSAHSTLMFECHISYACSLACKGCNRGVGLTRKQHTPDMTLDGYKAWLSALPDILKRKRHLRIIFTGGEPTLVPNLEDYVKETLRVAPMAKLSIATNEFTQESRELLAIYMNRYGMPNVGSAKGAGVPAYEFLDGMFLSPQDMGVTRDEPCPWSVRCGISVDSVGMTSCAMGGAVDGILGLGLRTRSLMELTDERLMKLCAHCGAWLMNVTKVDPSLYTRWKGQAVSKTWRAALVRLEGDESTE